MSGTGVDLVAALVEASATRAGLVGSAVVSLALDGGSGAVVEIAEGRVRGGAGDGADAAVVVPLTRRQLAAFAAGDDSFGRAYMRGDVKPVGSTGALLNVVELFEDRAFVQRFVELVDPTR